MTVLKGSVACMAARRPKGLPPRWGVHSFGRVEVIEARVCLSLRELFKEVRKILLDEPES